MTDQSFSAPSAPAFADSRELIEKLYSVATVIDDCKWVANALHLSASSVNESASHETNHRMKGVSRALFTTLRKASNDILALIEVLERRKEAES